MTPAEVSTILRAHNRWRRGGAGDMESPARLGVAFDQACEWLKLAEYARLWVLAEAAKREARYAFSLAMLQLDAWHPDPEGQTDENGRTLIIVYRIAVREDGKRTYRWFYNEHALRLYRVGRWPGEIAPPVNSGSADQDPRAIERERAWTAYRAARQHAGNRRRVLTRTVNRLAKPNKPASPAQSAHSANT